MIWRLVPVGMPRYHAAMKTLTVQLAKEQFSHILTEANRGDVIVLTDGERRMELEAAPPHGGALCFDLDEDSAELEAELLKAVKGPHAPFSESELRGIADRALAEETQARRDERIRFGEAQLRQLCAERGLNWDRLSEDEREDFVNRLLHEK